MLLPISSILKSAPGTAPIKRQITAALVVEYAQRALERLFPEAAPEDIQVRFLRGETLGVACSSPSVAQEIRLQEAAFKADLTKKFGAPVVAKIMYVPPTYQ